MRFITILISLMITSVSFGLDFSFLNNPDREFIPQSVWPDSKIDNLNFVDFEGDGFDDLIVVFSPDEGGGTQRGCGLLRREPRVL